MYICIYICVCVIIGNFHSGKLILQFNKHHTMIEGIEGFQYQYLVINTMKHMCTNTHMHQLTYVSNLIYKHLRYSITYEQIYVFCNDIYIYTHFIATAPFSDTYGLDISSTATYTSLLLITNRCCIYVESPMDQLLLNSMTFFLCQYDEIIFLWTEY